MVNLPTYSKTISIIEWWLSTQKVPNKADFASFHIYGHVTSDEAKNECIGNIFFKNQSCRQKKNQEELKKPQTRDYLSSKLVNNYAKCGFSSLIAKNTEKMIGWVLKTKTRMVQQNNRQQKKKISIWQQQSRRNHNDDEHNFFFNCHGYKLFFEKNQDNSSSCQMIAKSSRYQHTIKQDAHPFIVTSLLRCNELEHALLRNNLQRCYQLCINEFPALLLYYYQGS